ncbi:hypothetical protein HY945_00775 [Candidatus Gottesmanbacteria bacterium]|nr:hypothetical protein [Candidatus Gottesmanbacteria bacterium]
MTETPIRTKIRIVNGKRYTVTFLPDVPRREDDGGLQDPIGGGVRPMGRPQGLENGGVNRGRRALKMPGTSTPGTDAPSRVLLRSW